MLLKATALNRKLVGEVMMNKKQDETTSSSQTPLETVGEKQEAELDGCPIWIICLLNFEIQTLYLFPWGSDWKWWCRGYIQSPKILFLKRRMSLFAAFFVEQLGAQTKIQCEKWVYFLFGVGMLDSKCTDGPQNTLVYAAVIVFVVLSCRCI